MKINNRIMVQVLALAVFLTPTLTMSKSDYKALDSNPYAETLKSLHKKCIKEKSIKAKKNCFSALELDLAIFKDGMTKSDLKKITNIINTERVLGEGISEL